MARKKAVPKAPQPSKLDIPVLVRCIAEDCWAGGGGFLSKGDKALIVPEAAERLLAEGKVELVKG